jgi:hypothetical protein
VYASYIEIVFGVLLNFTEISWDSWGCWYSNFTFFFFIPVAVLAPYWVGWYCYNNYDTLTYYYVKARYGTAYDDINLYDEKPASLKPFLFLVHRQLIAFGLTMMDGAVVFKVWCFILSCEGYTLYVVNYKPYSDPDQQRSELFNLVCVIVICIHLLWFTEFVVDA